MEKSKPMRVSKEFEIFVNKVRQDIANHLRLPSEAISQPLVTQKIVEWANLGRKVEKRFNLHLKKQPDKLEQLDIKLKKLFDNLTE